MSTGVTPNITFTIAHRRCTPRRPGYTLGMKTAISIPDDVFADAERLAQVLNTSRSRLYARAVREFIVRHAPDGVTAALDEVCSEIGREAVVVAADLRADLI